MKREVESVLQESETSAAEAREQGAQLLAAAEVECARQRENVEWLQSALERAEDRAHALETAALTSSQSESQVAERTAAAVAKARAPLELRAEGLAVRSANSPVLPPPLTLTLAVPDTSAHPHRRTGDGAQTIQRAAEHSVRRTSHGAGAACPAG